MSIYKRKGKREPHIIEEQREVTARYIQCGIQSMIMDRKKDMEKHSGKPSQRNCGI